MLVVSNSICMLRRLREKNGSLPLMSVLEILDMVFVDTILE